MAQQVYTYKVRTRNGQVIKGSTPGESTSAIAQRLRRQGYYVISVQRQNQKTLWQMLNEPRGRVSVNTLSLFCRQFAVMLSSGMSVLDSLRLVEDQVRDVRMKKGLEVARQDVLGGSSLSTAFAATPNAFPQMVVQMVEAGETAGALTEVMDRLAIYYEREADTRAKIKEALMYPTVVSIVGIGATLVLIFFVLPNFVTIFEQMNMELPLATKLIMAFSAFMLRWWWAVFGVIAAMVYTFRRWLLSPKGQRIRDMFILTAPVIGPPLSKLVFSRMGRSLSLLARSGVPMVEALRIVERIVLNVPVAEALARSRAAVERGSSLTAAFTKEKVLPRTLVQMVAVGEETGNLDSTLSQLAEYYDREANYAIKGLTTLLEPIIIVGLTGVVLFLAIAVVLPMFKMATTVPQ